MFIPMVASARTYVLKAQNRILHIQKSKKIDDSYMVHVLSDRLVFPGQKQRRYRSKEGYETI